MNSRSCYGKFRKPTALLGAVCSGVAECAEKRSDMEINGLSQTWHESDSSALAAKGRHTARCGSVGIGKSGVRPGIVREPMVYYQVRPGAAVPGRAGSGKPRHSRVRESTTHSMAREGWSRQSSVACGTAWKEPGSQRLLLRQGMVLFGTPVIGVVVTDRFGSQWLLFRAGTGRCGPACCSPVRYGVEVHDFTWIGPACFGSVRRGSARCDLLRHCPEANGRF